LTALTARQAVSDGLDRVRIAASKVGLDVDINQVEVKTEEERLFELSNTPAMPDLVGVAEVQEILDIKSRQQVHDLVTSGRLPKPIAELKSGRVWLRHDIVTFGESWQRRPR
jgi:hypothetical protein